MINKVLDNQTMERTVRRLSYEIIEKHSNIKNVVLIGIRKKGVRLSQIICDNIKGIEGIELQLGELDITAYRDDIKKAVNNDVNRKLVPFDINGKVVILIDDVLFTGRTIRAAMDALIDLGRPEAIELAVMVDRGHRQLPIKANYIGKNIPTSQSEKVLVSLSDFSESDSITILKE
jgi:pyrimidine operon attenuation protein / uracil phosphoribosyltransferase